MTIISASRYISDRRYLQRMIADSLIRWKNPPNIRHSMIHLWGSNQWHPALKRGECPSELGSLVKTLWFEVTTHDRSFTRSFPSGWFIVQQHTINFIKFKCLSLPTLKRERGRESLFKTRISNFSRELEAFKLLSLNCHASHPSYTMHWMHLTWDPELLLDPKKTDQLCKKKRN